MTKRTDKRTDGRYAILVFVTRPPHTANPEVTVKGEVARWAHGKQEAESLGWADELYALETIGYWDEKWTRDGGTGNYGMDIVWSGPCFIKPERIEIMHRQTRRIARSVNKQREEHGFSKTHGQFIARVAKAVKAITIGVVGDDGEVDYYTPGDAVDVIDRRVATLIQSFGETPEKAETATQCHDCGATLPLADAIGRKSSPGESCQTVCPTCASK